MEFADYKIWPREGIYVEPARQRAIAQVLEASNLFERIPRGSELVIEVGREVPAGLTLAEAHGTWRAEYFPKIQTPDGLPRQTLDENSPPGLVHVEVNVIDKRTPGMGSHFGYQGYYLSILVHPDEGFIWDVRGERAS